MATDHFVFSTTKTIISEPGSLSRVGDLLKGLEVNRLIVVTDQGIVAAGLLERLEGFLKAAQVSYCVYDQVIADPPESVVLQVLTKAREEQVDGVLGFGGGSSMDVAKLVALLTHGEQSLSDIYGVGNARGQRLPLIQVPTTAGTGSEVTPIAIVTTGETTKMGVVAPQLLPDIALLDADLTLALPPAVTAATGIDAMVHAIEAYTSKLRKNLYSDMLAREALKLLSGNLVEAVHNGTNRQARANMLLGAMMAGQAFANAPVAAVHALAYPLGGHYHISHGLSNSLVLPHVLRFNLPNATELYAQLAHCLALTSSTDLDTGARSLIQRMEQFIEQVELPSRLRDLQVARSDLPMLAADAMLQQRLLVNNPREVTEADALAIYEAAY